MRLSGWRWRGQKALRLHLRVEPSTVVNTVLALLEKLEEEESVLVEAMCPPARLPSPGSCLCQSGTRSRDRPPRSLPGLDFSLLPQAVLHLALSWLCASVQRCVGFRVIGPY